MSADVGGQPSRWPTLLRWADQVCCIGLIVLSLGWMGATWVYQGGLRGGLVDIESAGHRPLLFQLDINRAEWTEWSF